MLTRTVCMTGVLGLLIAPPSAADEPPSADLDEGLVFYLDFDWPGGARLAGGQAHHFELEEEYKSDGRHGTAYRFEPPYSNFLRPDQASPDPGGFTAGPGVALASDDDGESVLIAQGGTDVLWRTRPVVVEEIKNPHRDYKPFIGSVYLRSADENVRVRLELVDEVDDTDWQAPIHEANEAQRADDDADIIDPIETERDPTDIELTDQWQRVTAGLRVDLRRPEQRLALKLTRLDADGDDDQVTVIEARSLQIEQYHRYPDNKNFAGPWLPGGESRTGNMLDLPLDRIDFDPAAGAIAAWVRLPEPEGGGSRSGAVITLGGGWGHPVWMLSTGHRSYAGDAADQDYTAGKSIIPTPHGSRQTLTDGQWHHMAMTWDKDTHLLFINGEEVGEAEYIPGAPRETAILRIGGNTLSGANSSVIVDEVAVWNRALHADEVAALATDAVDITGQLDSVALRQLERRIFHRGEESVGLELALARHGDAEPIEAELSIPALDVAEHLRFTGEPVTVTIKPWRAAPGTYPLTLRSDDGALDASTNLEIVPTLPSRDFLMLGWWSSPAIKELGFNAELTRANGLGAVLRRGNLASLRFDARDWHPLDPETYDDSLESARGTARAASGYPHIAASMINTEVSIRDFPDQTWFLERMERDIGLRTVPDNVVRGPIQIRDDAEASPIVSPDDEAYRFARWMIREGKGWPELNASIAERMRDEGLDDILYYTDQPTTTVDATGLDMVDFWNYPATAAGLVAQFNRVTNIAQLAGSKVSLMPGTIFWDPWPYHIDDRTVCLTPDLMRQFLWLAVAHPLDHLGLYGFGELERGYVPEGLEDTLRDTTEAVYPVGLLTGGLPQADRPVAYLHTDGQWWQGPGDNRWVETWFNRMATRALAEARLPYDIINDEHVEAGWLDRYEAVIVLGAWRVPERTHEALLGYAANGGEVVVDKWYRAELSAATVLEIDDRRHQDQDAIAALQDWARAFMEARGERKVDGEAWLLEKRDADARFMFVINDDMVPGKLGDEHGFRTHATGVREPVRDRGRPQRVNLTLSTDAAIYDVRAHRRLTTDGGPLELDLEPGDASVLAVLPEPIDGLDLDVPQSLPAGRSAAIAITIENGSGQPIEHRNVVRVMVTDTDGQPVDMPRYHRVEAGRIEVPLRLPLDTPSGELTIEAHEQIAGMEATATVRVTAAP